MARSSCPLVLYRCEKGDSLALPAKDVEDPLKPIACPYHVGRPMAPFGLSTT